MIGHPMRWRTWAELHRRELERRRRERVDRLTLLGSAVGVFVMGVSAWLAF